MGFNSAFKGLIFLEIASYKGWSKMVCKPKHVGFFNQNILSVFYVLLTVHLGSVLVNNQLDAQFFFFSYIFIPILYMFRAFCARNMRINCINVTSGICHSM